MADDTAAAPPTDLLSQLGPLLQQLQLGQPQDVPRDNTPVERSWQSKLGEKLAGPLVMQGMTPAEREAAGVAALGHFGTGLLNASGHMQGGTFGTLLGAGFQGAEQGQLGYEQGVASNLAARQEYQTKQQEMRIAALKEALPLLTLQQQMQQAQTARQLAGGGGGNIATGGSIAAPLSDDKATALKQIAARESGGDPTALNYVAKADPSAYDRGATASGKYQIVNSTWAEGAKLAGVDVAKYPTARDAPEGVQDQVASTLWDKYGNKPWQKGAQDWVKGADGRYALQPVAAPPGGAQPPKPYQVATAGAAVPPPPQGTTGGAPAAPPTVADLVGPRPLPPTGPGAGVATPASIANTPVQTAQAQPPAPAAAPVAQQPTTPPPSPYPDIKAGDGLIRHPGSFAEFSARESVPVPQTELYNPNLTPQQQAAFAATAKGIEDQTRLLGTQPLAKQPEIAAQIVEKRAALQAEMQTAAQAKAQAASAALEKYNENQQKQLQTRYDAATNAYTTAAQSQLASAQKASESDLTSRLASRTKVLEGLDTEATASHENLNQLRIVKQLSDAAGQPGVLTQYPEVRSWMTKLGIATPEQSSQWSAQQALDAATQKLTLAAAAGAGLGRITDKDLEFLRRGNPQSVNPQEWRNAQIAYLMTIYDRKQKFAGLVHQGVADGKSLTDAQTAADDTLGPLIKQMPKTNKDGTPMSDADRGKWNFDNLEPGQFYKNAGGDIQIFNPGKRRRPE